MVELESQVTDQTVELPVDKNGDDDKFVIRSLDKDPISRILLAIIAICGFGIFLLLLLVLVAALTSILGINLPEFLVAGEHFASTSSGLVLSIFLVATAVVSYLLLRHRVLKNPMLHPKSGCPQCWENELVRVRRHKLDRMIAHLGIPVQRYSCRNCHWKGLRVAGQPPDAVINSEDPVVDDLLQGDEILGVNQNKTATGENQ